MTTYSEKKAIIDEIRLKNRQDFGNGARQFVQKVLGAGLSDDWMYVYELIQNASDAGAKRVWFQTNGDTLLFQHDGSVPLDKQHVESIASAGKSTKGLDMVGFMGIGFKSVFARFLRAKVSGFGWRFCFNVNTCETDFGGKNQTWFDTLLPFWDDSAPDPSHGYTTAFLLENPIKPTRTLESDLNRIASVEDPTPLAVLAIRGLEKVQVGDEAWELSIDNGIVIVRRSEPENTWRWKFFVSAYRPDDEAMDRLLQVRQETHEQLDKSGQRRKRKVVGLLPLDSNGMPEPPIHGQVYATLPTQVQVPFGLHLQADWLVNLERQNLRDIFNDPWQLAIIGQVPKLIKELFLWLKEESEAIRSRGYDALLNPENDDGPLSSAFKNLRENIVAELAGLKIVPVHGKEKRRFCTPENVASLPGLFLDKFGKRPDWRPDLLFGHDIMDEPLLGKRASGFAKWLGWGPELEFENILWLTTLPTWWPALPEEEKDDALFDLWECVQEREWNDAPVVPTDNGAWVRAADTRWLNEEPPSQKEPSGIVIADALANVLPHPGERVSKNLRVLVNRASILGTEWLKKHHKIIKLADLIEKACSLVKTPAEFPLVELLDWALRRGDNRQDLVPFVMTEKGARKPEEALLADPIVIGGKSRRVLFSDKPALVEDYLIIDDQKAVVLFLERSGVIGGGKLEEIKKYVERYQKQNVAELLRIPLDRVEESNNNGYTIYNYKFPFAVDAVPPEDLQDWLTREHSVFKDKGRLYATSLYNKIRKTQGETPADWAKALQENPWVICNDNKRRKPGDVLIEPNPDFEDAPIARIDPELAQRLAEEGVRFGTSVSKSPLLRRLRLRADSDMQDTELADLLKEALGEIDSGELAKDDLIHELTNLKIRGSIPLDRLVKRTGPGTGARGDLGGWVIGLSQLDPALMNVINELDLNIPNTTTGRNALDFLRNIWDCKPSRVDEIRRHIAAAYRYVLDDAQEDLALDKAWQEARGHAWLYGGGIWYPIGTQLAIDDVYSPLIRRFIPKDRKLVASSHLGDTREQVRSVAQALRLGLLSEEVEVVTGKEVHARPFRKQLKILIEALGTLKDRYPLETAFFHKLALRVGGKEHDISAYIENGTMLLAGEPKRFATEAAGQLVNHFQLNQRGNEVAWLTGTLFSLEEPEFFNRNLQVLADGLGLTIQKECPRPEQETEKPDNGEVLDETISKGDASDVYSQTGGNKPYLTPILNENFSTAGYKNDRTSSERFGGRKLGGVMPNGPIHRDRGIGKNKRPQGKKEAVPGRRAADHARIVLIFGQSDQRLDSEAFHSGNGEKKSDFKARRAVCDYETVRGRKPEIMPENNPGFDIVSEDISTGRRRHIEVKGVQGIFEGNASVVLTATQVENAFLNDNDGVEYWLYVVDSTETDRPRVFPIPWTRHRKNLRYGFYASAWGKDSEQPAIVTENGLVERSIEALDPLDSGDLEEDWTPEEGWDN